MNNLEDSFWKVFKNKFILNLILNKIENSSSNNNNNNDYKKINYKEKLKFKEITSFEWMIKNNQFSLLKCKIKNKDERIDIDFLSLYKLFQIKDQSIVNEFSKLLIDYRYYQISKINLITISSEKRFNINFENESIKKLIQFLITIYTISKNNIKYELINGIKYNGTSSSQNNPINNNDSNRVDSIKIDIFLLFSIVDNDTLLNQLLNQLEYKKSSFYEKPIIDKEINEILLSNNNKKNDKVKELHKLFSISNNETIFNWYHGSNEYKTYFYFSWLRKYHTLIKELVSDNDLSIALSYSFNVFDGNVFSKLLSNHSNWNYNEYYPYPHEGLYYKYYYDGEKLDKHSESVYKFINLYTSKNNKHFKKDVVGNQIISFIFSLETNELYEKAVNSISKDCTDFNNVFPKIRNPYLLDFATYSSLGYLTIKDIDTVKWLISVEDNKFLNHKLDNFKQSIKFETYQVEEFAREGDYNRSKITKFFNEDVLGYNYEYPFIVSIFNCDVESAKYINNHKFGPNYIFKLMYINSLDKCRSQHPVDIITPTNQQLSNFSKYMKECNYMNFVPSIVKIFITMVLNRIQDDPEFDPYTCIDLDYLARQEFRRYLIELFTDSINTFKPKQIKFFLNIIKELGIVLTDQDFPFEDYSIYSTLYTGMNGEKGKCEVSTIDVYSLDDFDESLNLFFKIINDSTETSQQELYSNIIVSLYKKMIKFKNITPDKIKKYYQMIQQNQILIENPDSLYKSFFYLLSYSNRITKYIMEFPFLNQYFNNVQTSGFSEYSTDEEEGYYTIDKYLDPTVFSYNYLFCSGIQFDELIVKVIYHLSCLHLATINPNQNLEEIISFYERPYFNVAFNYNLQYLLDIRKVDLFFNHLDFIQSKLDDINFVVSQFPKIITVSENKASCCTDLKPIVNGRIFEFTKKTFDLACHVLNQDQFKRFSKFCSYYSIINQIPKDSNFTEYHLLKHFETINHIQTHHN